MLGERYHLDSEVVIGEAMRYADGLKLAGDGKDVWVFDVDETTLSNLPYYAKHGFGYVLLNHIYSHFIISLFLANII
ncbi:Acid phosphatase 1 [Linum perenne]